MNPLYLSEKINIFHHNYPHITQNSVHELGIDTINLCIQTLKNNENSKQCITFDSISEVKKSNSYNLLNSFVSTDNSIQSFNINTIYDIILSIYPSAQINIISVQDLQYIQLIQENKPDILIYSKNDKCNIIQDEINSFISHMADNNCSGIFISQNSGIINKDNFEINFQDNNILIYLHHVKNNIDKIKTAINIINSIYKSNSINKENVYIKKHILDNIHHEFNTFINQKSVLIKYINDVQSKIQKDFDNIKLTNIHNMLSTFYIFPTSDFICKNCIKEFKNKHALSAHLRGKQCGTIST